MEPTSKIDQMMAELNSFMSPGKFDGIKKEPHKAKSGFVPPNATKRTRALGDLSFECKATVKALSNIEKYWEPCRVPESGDWLDHYNHGCSGYEQFQGKKLTATKNTLYI